jgi:hypothetical protein
MYVLGARVWVVVEVYGIVMRSVKVCTLADRHLVNRLLSNAIRDIAHLAEFLFALLSQPAKMMSKSKLYLDTGELMILKFVVYSNYLVG